jgi:hypothetical protein
MPSHSGAPGMVRMTYLGLFAIDCDDHGSIFELGCTFVPEGGKLLRNSAASAAEF